MTRYRIVPVEATDDMDNAADEAFHAARKDAQAANAKRGIGAGAFASGQIVPPVWSAMLAARPELPDELVERMARAMFENLRPPSDTPTGPGSRWATWKECCTIDGWKDRQFAAMRAALSVLTEAENPSPDLRRNDGEEG